MKNNNILVAFHRFGYLAEEKWIPQAEAEKEIKWLALGEGGEAAYAFEGEMTDINRYCGLVMIHDKNAATAARCPTIFNKKGDDRCPMSTGEYFGQEFYCDCVIARMEYGKYVGLSQEDWRRIEYYRIDPQPGCF